jgi:hypothetical protein
MAPPAQLNGYLKLSLASWSVERGDLAVSRTLRDPLYVVYR